MQVKITLTYHLHCKLRSTIKIFHSVMHSFLSPVNTDIELHETITINFL